MMRFVYQGIRIQSRVYHNSVDEVVHHCSDAVDATKSIVERGLFYSLHNMPPHTRAVFEELDRFKLESDKLVTDKSDTCLPLIGAQRAAILGGWSAGRKPQPLQLLRTPA